MSPLGLVVQIAVLFPLTLAHHDAVAYPGEPSFIQILSRYAPLLTQPPSGPWVGHEVSPVVRHGRRADPVAADVGDRGWGDTARA